LPADLRSPQGRRFKDLCRIYAADLGGLDELAEGDLTLVRTAAGLTVESERLQCLIVEGKGVSHDAAVRLSSETRRILERLEARSAALQQQRQQPQSGGGLQDYLAAKASSP
jgi:ribosomal protein L12E/L44/L45/RPP1/RPP2